MIITTIPTELIRRRRRIGVAVIVAITVVRRISRALLISITP